jgi:hypothetical protein
MKTYSYETYKSEIQSIVDFYNFFHIPGKELEKLVKESNEFKHFYYEYVGKFTGLDAEKIILFISKSGYRQTAMVFHAIYKKSDYSESEYTLAMSYLSYLVTLRSIALWFYNYTWDDVKTLMEDCPEIKPLILAVQKKNTRKKSMIAIHDYQFLEIFLNASSEGKAGIMYHALKVYKEEAERGIKHGLDLYRVMEGHIKQEDTVIKNNTSKKLS